MRRLYSREPTSIILDGIKLPCFVTKTIRKAAPETRQKLAQRDSAGNHAAKQNQAPQARHDACYLLAVRCWPPFF